ncbi:MAG: hypothetical protein HKN25_05245 [Pyrinomonadaceae bacterium]|nr:hypothetical protein [Pyrinomonadaceae bacterium]
MKFGLDKVLVAFTFVFVFCGIGYAEKCTQPGSIKRVKNRSAGNVEYVIFDLLKRADTPNSAPDYEVKSASGPFTDYSGDETIPVRGKKFKSIVFKNLYWMCESRDQTKTPRAAVRDIKQLSRFEGIAEYVVGFRSRSRYITTYHYNAGSVIKVVMKFRK